MRFTLYPIYWLARSWDDEPFDLTALPFEITEGVSVESVSERFRKGAFDLGKEKLGTDISQELESVRYALVHRYDPDLIIDPQTGEVLSSSELRKGSERSVRSLAACLRVIRPMRQRALMMWGNVREDDSTFDVTGYDVPPLHLIEVPDIQKLFSLRNRDAIDLRAYAPEFLRAMRGEFWKFRMAVEFHEQGHFHTLYWKARFLLWCSAIESIYTSHAWEHQGSLVAKSRIKWFLGEDTSIYAPGDIPSPLDSPRLSIADVLDDLYEMRNFIAHGDRLPDPYFSVLRDGLAGEVSKAEVLVEAASFIIRATLLKILGARLLDHFAGAGPAEAYFGAQKLMRSELQPRAARG